MSEFKKYIVHVYENYVEWREPINNNLHREGDLPALEYSNGDKYWYINGVLHRDRDRPPIVLRTGEQRWQRGDILHRETGPALILENGEGHYYLDNKRYATRKEWLLELEKRKNKQLNNESNVLEIGGKKYKLVEVEDSE